MIREEKETNESKNQDGALWYVVQTEPNRERFANFHLEGRKFETYLPMRLCAAKSKAMSTPLFPRYMFVRLDFSRRDWTGVFATPGVAAVITQTRRDGQARPAAVPSAVVDTIREKEINGLTILGSAAKVEPCPFEPGDKLRIKRGTQFGELDAIFCERVDANRVAILLSLLGRDSRIVLHVSTLERS